MSPSPTDHKDTFPQPHHDDSSLNHYTSLFEHDQLTQERTANRTRQGLKEAAITFAPTYKYTPKGPFLTPDEQLTEWHWRNIAGRVGAIEFSASTFPPGLPANPIPQK
jgi:hypothetical protein